MSPQIDVFVTTIFSSGPIRGRHERVDRVLRSLRLPFISHDVASDEQAKAYWKRKNGGNNELPCILVDGVRPGSIDEFDEAVEYGELRQFLRLDSTSSASAAAPAQAATTTPTPTPTTKIDETEFDSLNLSPSELASLSSTTSSDFPCSSNDIYTPTPSTSSSYTYVPTLPLSFKKSDTGKGLERHQVISAGPERKIKDDAKRDEELIDGLGLSEEEARALARELGLVHEDQEDLIQYLSINGSTPTADKKEGKLNTEKASIEKEGQEEVEDKIEEQTSVSGAGGAELSTSVEKVEQQLQLSPLDVAHLKLAIRESGTTLDVAGGPTPSQIKTADVEKPLPLVLDDAPASSSEKHSTSTVKEVAQVKIELGSGTKPVEDTPLLEFDGKVALAIRDGLF